jgi:hypothetical protein
LIRTFAPKSATDTQLHRPVALKFVTAHFGELQERGNRLDNVRRLTLDDRNDLASGWTRDSRTIYFASDRHGTYDVFTQAIEGGTAEAVAMALTRETDYLDAGDPAVRPAAVKVDEKGRIQTYPAIDLLGSIPIAVIQSNGDSYLPGEEARRLFGPDTSTRHLYQVKASNHGFSGGKDELLRDLDDALTWIEGLGQKGGRRLAT